MNPLKKKKKRENMKTFNHFENLTNTLQDSDTFLFSDFNSDYVEDLGLSNIVDTKELTQIDETYFTDFNNTDNDLNDLSDDAWNTKSTEKEKENIIANEIMFNIHCLKEQY